MSTTVVVAGDASFPYSDYYSGYNQHTHIDLNTLAITMVAIAILSLMAMIGVLVWTKKITCEHFSCH